jgi:hypothetical protein
VVVNGESTEILIGFRNKGEDLLKVVGLNGRFTLPNDFDRAVRNV